MIGGFFTKDVGGAKFCRFRNTITTISHNEYEPVDLDELTTMYDEKDAQQVGHGTGRLNSSKA